MPSNPAFIVHFDQHVWPDLAALARVRGTEAACGLLSFAAATDDLMRVAVVRGAAYLPDLDALHDRVMTLVAHEVERAERVVVEVERQAETNPSAFWLSVWRPIWAKGNPSA